MSIKLKKLVKESKQVKSEIVTRAGVRGGSAGDYEDHHITGLNYPGVDVGATRSSRYLVTLANNAEGRSQLEMLKKALKDEYNVVARGRHHDRKEVLGSKWVAGTQNDVPLKQAEFWAIYLYPKI